MPKSNMRVIQAASREAEVYIYEDIGDWFGGMSAVRFKDELKALGDVDKITVFINSLGGDVFDGLAIYNELKNHPARVTTHVNGVAASAASIIAMAGRKVIMGEGSFLMIHKAWSVAIGNSDDMLKLAGDLEIIDSQLAEIYSRKSGKPAAEIMEMMRAETWLTADMALESKLADKAIKTDPKSDDLLAAYGDRVLARCANIPAPLMAQIQAMKTNQQAINDQDPEPEPEPAKLYLVHLARQVLSSFLSMSLLVCLPDWR